MKTLLLALGLAAAVILAGCASRYRITLSNGSVITSAGKPRLDASGTAYRFKDIQGAEHTVPAIRVKEIEPQ